jgi:hypothetical protein
MDSRIEISAIMLSCDIRWTYIRTIADAQMLTYCLAGLLQDYSKAISQLLDIQLHDDTQVAIGSRLQPHIPE